MRVSTVPIIIHGDALNPDPKIIRTDADHDHVIKVLSGDPNQDDTRSQWQWFRLPNGDLALGVFPQGDTYLSVVDEIEWPDHQDDRPQPFERTEPDVTGIRLGHLDEALDYYGAHNIGFDTDGLKDQVGQVLDRHRLYLLVEASVYDHSHEFSLHPSPNEAFNYQANQECVEDWEPVSLINLDNGVGHELTRDVTYEVRFRASNWLT